MDGLDGYGWDLCVGLLYEHRFAMLIRAVWLELSFVCVSFCMISHCIA